MSSELLAYCIYNKPANRVEYIVPRVMDYGTLADVRFVMKYYGKRRIIEILLDAPALQRRFVANYYSLPQESFKAYLKPTAAQWKS